MSDRSKIIEQMKNIDFKRIELTDRKMTNMVRKLLTKSLQFNPSRRIESADKMMFMCYEILRRYNIRYARHAVLKFLIDKQMAKGPFEGFDQNIYLGD